MNAPPINYCHCVYMFINAPVNYLNCLCMLISAYLLTYLGDAPAHALNTKNIRLKRQHILFRCPSEHAHSQPVVACLCDLRTKTRWLLASDDLPTTLHLDDRATWLAMTSNYVVVADAHSTRGPFETTE